jgi:hypothetical protein
MESAYALSSNRDELIVVKSKDFSRISVSNAHCNDLPSFPHPFTSSRIHLLRSQTISVYNLMSLESHYLRDVIKPLLWIRHHLENVSPVPSDATV